jgi:hypothetical protein
MDTDITSFLTTGLMTAPILVGIVLGIVQLLKKVETPDGGQAIKGNALLFSSCAVGGILGIGYRVLVQKPPEALDWHVLYSYWFVAFLFGIAVGLVAAGVFKVNKDTTQQAIDKAAIEKRLLS